MNIVARPEVYNTDLALLLSFSTIGLVALFMGVRKLLMERDDSNGKPASIGGVVAVGLSGFGALQMSPLFGAFVASTCVFACFVYRCIIVTHTRIQQGIEDDARIRDSSRSELESLNAKHIAATNRKREAMRTAGLNKIGGGRDE